MTTKKKWYRKKRYWIAALILILFVVGVVSVKGTPTFRNLPKKVSNPSMTLAGYGVEKGADVKIYLNNNLASEVKADDEGNFQTTLNLKEGQNVLYAEAMYKGKIRKSAEKKITFAIDVQAETKQESQQEKKKAVVPELYDYEIVKKEVYANPTAESWNKAAEYIKTMDVVAKEASSPQLSITIYFKNDGISIDVERMKQTYSIKDIAALEKAMADRSLVVSKGEIMSVVIARVQDEGKLKRTVEKIIQEESAGNEDIDEIGIYIYDTKGEADNLGNAIASAKWSPEGLVTEKIARDNTRDGYSTKFLHFDLRNYSNPATEVTDNERKIFYRYCKLSKDAPIIAFNDKEANDMQDKEIFGKLGKEYDLLHEEAKAIVDKVKKSMPTDFEMKVKNALEKKFNDRADRGEWSTDETEKQDDLAVAKQFGITPDDVYGIWIHVMSWLSIKK